MQRHGVGILIDVSATDHFFIIFKEASARGLLLEYHILKRGRALWC